MTSKHFAGLFLAAVCTVAGSIAHAQAPIPQPTLAWGHETIMYRYANASCDPVFHASFNLRDPSNVDRGLLVPPLLSSVDCSSGTWSGNVPSFLFWGTILPGPLTIHTWFASPGCCTPGLVGPDVTTQVYFRHDFAIPQLGASVTISTVYPFSYCGTRKARFLDSSQAPFAPPPGLASPAYIAFDSSDCTLPPGYPPISNRQNQVIAIEFAQAPGDVWVLDAQSSTDGTRSWRKLSSEIHGNVARFGLTGDTSSVSGALAVTYIPSIPPVSPTPDLWWGGSAEAGWGLNIAASGDNLFVSGFIYDQAGKPTWIVMPNGQWDAFHTTWKGNVYIPHGSPYASYSGAALDMRPSVGSASLDFSNPEQGSFDFVIDGYRSSKPVSRFVFVPGAGAGAYAGIWWGGTGQDGWGLSIAQQGETLFATWYTYGADGMPTWFYMPSPAKTGEGKYSGTLYRTTGGPWLSVAQYNGAQTQSIPVGTMELSFKDGQSGTMSATVDGTKVTNAIQRFGF